MRVIARFDRAATFVALAAALAIGAAGPVDAQSQPAPAPPGAQSQRPPVPPGAQSQRPPAPPSAQPQPAPAPPNALQGFSQNRDQPIKIDSAALEVRDKEKTAIFSGNVQLVQGDTVLRCKSLVVFYDTNAKSDAKPDAKTAAAKEGGGQQNIRRIEVLGDVIVTQKDQKATADKGFFDMKTNMITLQGNVVISQGQNVVKGDRLSVDLTTSVSRVECEKSSQCRVQALLQPGGKDGSADIKDLMMKPKQSAPSGM